MNFPAIPSVSSQGSKPFKKRTKSVKTEKSTNLDHTPSKGPSFKIRKIAPSVDEVKIIKVPRVMQESEDDMLTVSSSSYEGFSAAVIAQKKKEMIIVHTPIKLKMKAEQLQATITMI